MKSFTVSTLLCVTLLAGAALASTTELLYVQEGQNILTYSVNNTTAVATKLSTLKTSYDPSTRQPDLGITILRSGSFLYVLGRSHSLESFTVYPLTAAGVPIAKPVQILSVKPQVKQGQFYIDSSGKFAYVMFSWTQTVGGNFGYASDIVLFTIDPMTGILTNTTKVLANFPLTATATTSMHSMNTAGTRLYIVNSPFLTPTKMEVVLTYSSYTINAKTGGLGKSNWSWSDLFGDFGIQYSVFSDALIVQLQNGTAPTLSVNVYPNKAGVNPNAPLIKCTSKMLAACGDVGLANFWLDPSGKYLFLNDSTVHEVPVAFINTATKKMQASDAAIPGNPDPVAFSPHGLLVYGVEKSEVLVYVFHSGKFTAKGTINAPGVISLLPWQ
jgi:hypothetical protein